MKKSAGLNNANWLALDKRNCDAWRIVTLNLIKIVRFLQGAGAISLTFKFATPAFTGNKRPNSKFFIVYDQWWPGPTFASLGVVVGWLFWITNWMHCLQTLVTWVCSNFLFYFLLAIACWIVIFWYFSFDKHQENLISLNCLTKILKDNFFINLSH